MKYKDINKLPQWAQKQIKGQLNEESSNDKTGRNSVAKSKCNKQKALDVENETSTSMVDITGPVIVRLTRCGKRKYDDDNYIAGNKALRDAIASALGRKGDSEEDGMYWEYRQEIGQPATVVEIFKQGESHDTM